MTMKEEGSSKKMKKQTLMKTQSTNEKVKKQKKKKKKSVNKLTNGPPSNADEFSSNWKKFLDNQLKTDSKGEKSDVKSDGSGKKNDFKSKNNGEKNNSKYKNKGKKIDCNAASFAGRISTKDSKNKPNRKRKRSECIEDSAGEANEIWFDVDPELLKKTERQNNNNNTSNNSSNNNNNSSNNNNNNNDNKTQTDESPQDKTCELNETSTMDKENSTNLTRYLALDCEMVGVGIEGKESVLARVSIVNSRCACIYDKFVKSAEKVVDYRTHVSGVRAKDLQNATDYATVQEEVSEILKGRVVVGHALQNDFKVLMLSHPAKDTRDTSKYKPFRTLLKTKRPALKRLVDEILHQEIQTGEHSSIIDAQMTMRLYKKFKKEWEKSLHCKGAPNTVIEPKEVFMGTSVDQKKKRKVNKWKKIRDRKKKKQREE